MRRTLHIVNPISYFNLSKAIVAHWSAISKQFSRSTIGLSFLTNTPGAERSFKRHRTLEQLPRERASRLATQRYMLKTDITRFFPSIYTHSIPWALHAKSVAKRRKNDQSLFGNLLDKLLRNSQDQQTTGIPIGPDTSHVIAELLLARVDEQLGKRFKLHGFRYVDDFELGFSNKSDAELCGNELQSILSEYELDLNAQKTGIFDLPQPFDQTWVTELRTLPVSRYRRSQHYHFMHLFNRAFELFHEDRARNVLRYALSRIRNVPVHIRNWKEYQGIVCQSMIAEPGATKFALDCLWKQVNDGLKLDKDLLQNALASVINYHAPLSHDSEVCWSLWAAILLEVKLGYRTLKQLLKTEQVCIMLLVLDGVRKGLFSKSLDVEQWKQYVSKDELYNKYWLLTYENGAAHWLKRRQDYIKKDPRYGFLFENGVRFYNENAAEQFQPTKKELVVYEISS